MLDLLLIPLSVMSISPVQNSVNSTRTASEHLEVYLGHNVRGYGFVTLLTQFQSRVPWLYSTKAGQTLPLTMF